MIMKECLDNKYRKFIGIANHTEDFLEYINSPTELKPKYNFACLQYDLIKQAERWDKKLDEYGEYNKDLEISVVLNIADSISRICNKYITKDGYEFIYSKYTVGMYVFKLI